MNERIKELAEKAGAFHMLDTMAETPPLALLDERIEKFAELLLKEVTDLMQERWYELNDEPKAEDESLRDVGVRIGKKSELVRMKQVINSYFGISVQ